MQTLLSLFILLSLILFPAASAYPLDPAALPTGGQITSGAGTISQSGAAMTVNQATDRMIANWNTFNIGRDASVTFRQPGASSVALNRILDQNPSLIYGRLSANGQVFLLNPSGVYFGPASQVDVGGLVASSLTLTNENFLAGRYLFEHTGSAGSILNQGNIRAAGGGYIAFLSPHIANEGTITATNGAVALASGDRVNLDFTGDSLVSFTVEKGAIDALIENRGFIRADGGAVLLTAKAADALTNAVVNNEGIIEAHTLASRSGRILLLSDGEAIADGTLDASAPDGGDGGFIETSGKKVTIKDALSVTTSAPYGKTGTWLIDPENDYKIAPSGGDITGSQLSSNLGSNNVTILSSSGGTAGNGDIFVNDNITWSVHKLALNAYRNIKINSALFGSGTAQLFLLYGQGAIAAGNTATYTVNAPVNLPAGNNFSTTLGLDGVHKVYTVITSLGSAGSTTAIDLQGMAGNLGGYYALGANIDASVTSGWNTGAGFVPIGNDTTKFTGAFDGLGHTISGHTINRSYTDYVGLFGYIGSGAAVNNVGLLGGSVKGVNNYVGGLVGYNDGTITNSYATGSVEGNDYVGGLVGANLGTVTNSYATGSVTGGYSIGGLVGANLGTITDSYATGSVTGNNWVGGLVGYNYFGTITGSYATGSVTGNDYVGGLVGVNVSGTITDSYATGSVTGNDYVGGLVGRNSSGTITNAYWDTETSGQSSSSGGTGLTTAQMMQQASFSGWDFTNTWWMSEGNTRPFLRMEYSTTITNAHQLQLIGMNTTTLGASYTLAADIDMAELKQASGLWNTTKGFVPIGNNTTKFTGAFDGLGHTISDLFINRPSTDYVGLFGYIGSGVSVSNVGMAGGSVTGSDSVGGLAGCNAIGTITNSYATGDVSGGIRVGGLVGWNAIGTVTNSYATGDVTGDMYVGGLVGRNSSGTVTNSYATGDVSGTVSIGGLVGYNAGTITDSYATGKVTGCYTGGLVAANAGTVTNSYWDTQISGQSSSGGGTGKTTTEMQTLSTFSAWDIDGAGGTGETWRIYEGYTYPLLRHFLTPATATVDDTTMVYNGSTTVAGGSHTWDIAVDAGKIFGTAAYTASSKNVGIRTLSLTGLYSNQQGYDIKTVDGTVDITKAALTVATGNVTKTYDGNTTAAGTAVVTSGSLFGTDSISGGTFAFTDKNAGIGNKTVTTSGVTVNDDNAGGNYDVSYADNTTSTINPYAVSLTGTRAYDGTINVASGILSFGPLVGTETLTVSGTGTVADKHVGTGKAITLGTLALGDGANGGLAANYTFTGGTQTVDITKAALTVATGNVTKTYDGNTTAAGTAVVTSGSLFGTDSISGGTFAFTDKNAGIGNKTVTTSGVTVNDDNAGGNYDVSYADNTTSTINPKGLTASYTGSNKVYDGTAAATVAGSSGDIVGGDTVTFSETANFVDKNAGVNKKINVTDIALGGADSGNYALTGTTAATAADITPALLTITANDDNRIYSGVPYSGGNGVIYAGFAGGETQAVLGGTLQYGGGSQGAINPGTYAIDPFGLTSGNYAISFANGILTIGGSSWASMESVSSVLTCTLNMSNGTATLMSALNTTGGTQEGRGGYPGTHNILFIGPGTGSTTLTNFINTTLVGP